MTIRKPDFILVDECPDWCTIDHKRVTSGAGDHTGDLVRVDGADVDVNGSLVVEEDSNVRVDISIEVT